MMIWSVKDYNGVSYPSDKLFLLKPFPLFGVASSKTIDAGLVELKDRAKAEHVNYIETMTGVYGDDAIKIPGNWFDNSLAWPKATGYSPGLPHTGYPLQCHDRGNKAGCHSQ